ncbi:TerD family protein [Streptomyces stramineus]
MTELAKGANAPISDGPITAELHGTGEHLDLSALLIGADGKVRSDADMVFFNQPAARRARSATCPPAPGNPSGSSWSRGPPPSVHRVVLVAGCDPSDATRTFGGVRDLSVRAVQGSGAPVLFPVPPMTGGERAAVLMEIYRRGPAWKIRAVGQGYASGLAGVATDFGVQVDDAPAPAPAPIPAPVPANLTKPRSAA